MENRLQRYAKIRRLLNRPMEQKPDADQILSQMFMDEQAILLRLANTGQGWNVGDVYPLRVNPGQSEYRVDVGKVYFVTMRGGDNLNNFDLPIDFVDFNDSNAGGRHFVAGDGWHLDPQLVGGGAGAGIKFFRRGGESFASVNSNTSATYQIYSFASPVDRYAQSLEQSGVERELSDYTDLSSALALLAYTEWRPEDAAENINYNSARRSEISKSLAMQISRLDPVIDRYIMQINEPASIEMPYWNQ